MHQRVIFVEADLDKLRKGGILTLVVEGRPPIEIGYEVGNGAKRKSHGGGGLAGVRGDCPYCDSKGVLLSAHVRSAHPGKVIPYTGDGYKCPHCAQRYPSHFGVQRHVRVSHKGKKLPTREQLKKEPAKSATP
jgi:hypothetical protein